MSALILAAFLKEVGLQSAYVDGSRLVTTDEHFGDAAANMGITTEQIQQTLGPLFETGVIPVVTGYCGSTQSGQPTTLGRGGSDTTGTILGAALKADEVWIWTDVDGILTTDPRICPGAQVIPEITFSEAIELSYYGAKVIHRRAVRHALAGGIPVRIKNSFQPDLPGTKITDICLRNTGPIKAVTAMSRAALVTIRLGNDHRRAADILGRLFLRLANDGVDILFSMQLSAENSLSLVFREEDSGQAVASIERLFRFEFKQSVIESLSVQRDLAVVVVLSEDAKDKPDVIARLYGAVARSQANVIASAHGANELCICLAVPSTTVLSVVRSVHDEFFSSSDFSVENVESPALGSMR